MKIDRRITNGLAWAGVALVVGVPTADLLSAQFSPSATPAREQVAVVSPVAPVPAPANQRPATPVSKPAAPVIAETPVQPAAPVASKPAAPTTQTADVVDSFVQSGKPLPSYITGAGKTPAQVAAKPGAAPAAAAAKPTTAPAQVAATPGTRTPIITTPSAGIDPVEVAAIPPQKVAPTPMPLSMRPAPIRVPVVAGTVPPADIVLPPELAAPVRSSGTVTAAELEDWETGPLSEFLERRQGSSATVTSDYDPNGFFLDEGPSQPRGDRVVGWEEPGFSFFAD